MALEADLRDTYGVRLADVWAGRESARHVLALIDGLGEGSRLVADSRGGIKYRGWTYERYMHTLTVNVLQMMLWVLANQGAAASKQSARPAPLPTPEKPEPAQPGGMTLAGFVRASFYAAARQRRNEQRQSVV